MAKVIKKVIAAGLSMSVVAGMMVSVSMTASAESSTGVGLSAHALRAYREGWSYVWGGTSYGAVDCSGLIYTYNGVGGSRVDMLGSSYSYGYVSNGVPNIHGLGLHSPGHVGVYIGSGMAVDARDEYSGVVYHNVYSRSWVEWFKIAGVSYPTNGWVLFDGDSFYYENGEYITSTSRTIDGVTYSFDSAGVSDMAPPASSYEATDYSSASAQQAPVYYEQQPSEETQQYEESSEEPEPEQPAEESSEEESSEQPVEESSEEESSEQPAEESSEEESSEQPAEESSEEESSEEPVEESSEESSEEPVEQSKTESSAEESEKPEESSEEPEKEVKIIASYGDEDEEGQDTIKKIQTRLIRLGYLTEQASGYFGNDTADALLRFQEKNGLEATGIADEETVKKLNSENAKSGFGNLEPEMYDDGEDLSITSMQTRLAELKYYYDDITGFYGDLTKNAVEQFQKNNGLKVTGIADDKTLMKLYDSKTEKNPYADGVVFGQNGSVVLKLQKRLIELRYLTGEANGKFDDRVLKAVNLFQKTAGLDVSENMTAKQLAVLNAENAPKAPDYDTLKLGYSGDDVADLQSKLAMLKYYNGKTSGKYTEEVEEAVKQFQNDYGLEVTGIADSKTKELITTESQRESSKMGDELILKTAKVSDSALAQLADSKTSTPGEIVITSQSGSDFVKTIVILGSVVLITMFLGVLFIIELKRKKRKSDDVEITSYYKRRF